MLWGYHGFFPFGFFFVLIVLFVIFRIFAFRRFGYHRNYGNCDNRGWNDNNHYEALAIVRKRLANGEISEEEYEHLKEVLSK